MHIIANIINAIKRKYTNLATFEIAHGRIRGLNPTSTPLIFVYSYSISFLEINLKNLINLICKSTHNYYHFQIVR